MKYSKLIKMYKTVLKKRSATITRRNISPRTDPEPDSPTILEAPKIAFNIVYPPMNFSRVQNVLARTIVGAKHWTRIDDSSKDAIANHAYDVNEAVLNVNIDNFNYGDTVEIASDVQDYPSTIVVNGGIRCDSEVPRLAITKLIELETSSPQAFSTSLNGSDTTIDTYTVITDKWSLRIYSQEKDEFIYETDEFESITSVQVLGNEFWFTCPTYYFNNDDEENYSLIKGTINYNSTTHVYTISYEYYFTTVSAKKVCLSTTQYNIADVGNWIGILSSTNTMYVSNNNGVNWFQIESLSDDTTWNDLSITSDGYALVIGNKNFQFIDIEDDDDITDDIGFIIQENWISCSLQMMEDYISIIIASENSAYTTAFYWWDNPVWKRLPINDSINEVHTVFYDETDNPVYAITTKNHFYYINTNYEVTTPVKYGFNGNYILSSFNWQSGVYSLIQVPTDWTNDITIQDFFILALEMTYFGIPEGGLYVWGNTNLTLRRDANDNFTLKTLKDSGSMILGLPDFNSEIVPLASKTYNLFKDTQPPDHRVSLDSQPQRILQPNALQEKNTNIIIPTVRKFVKPTKPDNFELNAHAKQSTKGHLLLQKFKHTS